MSWRITLILVAAISAFAGCQTNPITGRTQFMIVSEEQAQSASAQAYASTVSDARTKGKLDTDVARTQRVKRITDHLITQAQILRPESKSWQWSVHVIDDPQVNAWCMPGGKMVIYTGLIQKLNATDDEIAQVMGHEISHALLQHGREQMSRALATQVGLQAGSILAGTDVSGLAPVAQVALLLPNSRGAESEADRLGMELAAKAGYNPQAAVTLWTKMGKLGGSQPVEILSTHPSNQTRIDDLTRLVPQMAPYYEAAKAERRSN